MEVIEITNRVISLPLAQRLKSLGVPQVSHFYWVKGTCEDEYTLHDFKAADSFSAFLSEELGAIIGDCQHRTSISGRKVFFGMVPRSREWKGDIIWREGATEAEARGNMVQHLLESNLIQLGRK